jgi:phage baseplate assembly protein W
MSQIQDSYLEDLEFIKGDFKPAPNSDFQLIKGIENLKQALYHRLITVPGTLVHRPLYGVGVKRWQNQLGSLAKQQELALVIKQQFEQDSRVSELVTVRFKQESDGLFAVQYVVNAVGTGEFSNTVDPFGDLTF